MDAKTLEAIKASRSGPGLRDNLAKSRRELYLEWEGKLIFHGWCMASSLPGAGELWKPSKPFGTFA